MMESKQEQLAKLKEILQASEKEKETELAKVFMQQEEWKDISRKMYEIEERQWEIKYNEDTAKQMAIAAEATKKRRERNKAEAKIQARKLMFTEKSKRDGVMAEQTEEKKRRIDETFDPDITAKRAKLELLNEECVLLSVPETLFDESVTEGHSGETPNNLLEGQPGVSPISPPPTPQKSNTL